MVLSFVSLPGGIFFGGIGGADFDFGGVTSSNCIKGSVALAAARVPVGRSGISFLRGGKGRVLREEAGEGGGCHRWVVIPIGTVPVPVGGPRFGPSTSTTQSFRSSKLDFRPRLGGDGEGECRSLPLNESTLFNGLGPGDGAMVEKVLAVGEIGSSRMLVASPGVSASSTSSPKSFMIFGVDWGDFLSLRASRADILDWMDVEGDMINYVSTQSCLPHLPKDYTLLQVAGGVNEPFNSFLMQACRLLPHPNGNRHRPFRTSLEVDPRANLTPLPEQVAEYIAECQRVLEKSGLKYKVCM